MSTPDRNETHRDRADPDHSVSPPTADDAWSIARTAAEFGLTHRTLRFYESRGLIAPRRDGTRRWFLPRDRVRIALILRGKRLGFDLDEIGRIIDMYDSDIGERGQITYLLNEIERRRRELEQRRADISATLEELAEVETRCREALR